MRKIFSYISKVLLFIGVVYAEPDSKVEALEGRKQESSLDKKIRQELKNKELKNKDLKNKEEKKNTAEKKTTKTRAKPRAEVHHGDAKNPTQKITPPKIKEGAKGVQNQGAQNQGVQNNAPKPEKKDTTPQATEKNKETSPSSQFNSIFGNPNNAANNTLEDKVVGGISLLVNGSPITLYQIQEEQEKSKVSKAQARDRLIAERIKNQEIERLKIHVDDDKLDQEMAMMAQQQGMDLDHFKQMLMAEGHYKLYRDQLKEHLEMQELLRNILLTNVDTSSETKMREYYNKHKEQFSIPTEIETVRYTSTNQEDLERAMSNPNLEVPGVSKANEKIEMKTLNPQIAQVFISHEQGSFTPVMNGGGGQFITFYIKEKKGKNEVSFSQAKQFIAQKLVEESKDKILEEHFEKLRVKSRIVMIRE
ncbi:SurA protein [Helicobacter pylori]|uniref:SurA protein n=1 Tax=Helicobacter pylori HP260AFii TaxID=1159077 RepID=A0ABC9S9B5_HELPX|nr:SurA protein [Helicobacter pylori]EMH18516.1 SurA protein [Helicobacter pylori GAM260ASi]EMH28860.1 SurA protein [Helicobacter pylori GAM268Bii]EMH62259.1 SurA protein [Helicobacter pylori HP260AFi]EMH66410.1 SurA protein [Helicobacter pylori HP260ASii]EMH66656.1 SurA protein [Helicobacter pylori HP260AFii]